MRYAPIAPVAVGYALVWQWDMHLSKVRTCRNCALVEVRYALVKVGYALVKAGYEILQVQ